MSRRGDLRASTVTSNGMKRFALFLASQPGLTHNSYGSDAGWTVSSLLLDGYLAYPAVRCMYLYDVISEARLAE